MKPILFFLFASWQTLMYCQPSPCDNAVLIACGQIHQGTTVGGMSQFESEDYGGCYSDSSPFNGNDVVYQLDVTERKNIHLYLEMLDNTDLDMFVLGACSFSEATILYNIDGGGCVATLEDNAFLGIYTESIDFIAEPGTYYIVVDGYNTMQGGDFKLTVGCTCNCTEEPDPDLFFGRSIRCEDFEHYETTDLDPQSNRWRLFDANNSVAYIQTESGNEYLRIVRNVERPDVIYELTDLTDGRHRISWKMFVETGKGGYYNLLNRLPDEIGQFYDLAYEVVFNADGSGNVTVKPNQIIPFTYRQNAWMDIMQIVDPANDLVEFWIDHEFISSWKYTDGADVSPYRIEGINFYGLPGNNYRVNNICAWEVTGDIIKCLSNEVCVKNGIQFEDECSASHDFLFTPDEYGNCFSVCDFGGSLIYRDDIFIGTIDADDEIPNLVRNDDCIMATYGGSIPSNYGAVIKVFFNDTIAKIFPSDPGMTSDSVKLFIFQCVYDSKTQKATQIYKGEVTFDNTPCPAFDIGIDQDSGFYYLVFIGPVGDNFGTQMFPNGYCLGTAQLISCGQTIDTTLNNEINDFDLADTDKGDYAKCYNGIRTYTGKDMLLRFDLTEPSIVNLSLQASDQKAFFLYDYLCAKNCIGYAETPNSGGTGSLSDLHLVPGTYYVIVDAENNLDPSFSLSLNCDIDLRFYEIFTGIDDPGTCPIVSDPDSIHKFHVLDFASTTDLKPTTYVAIGYRDGEETKNVVQDFWNSMPSQLFNLPPDFRGDTTKCGFEKNDDIQVTLYVNPNGNGFLWVPCNVSYAPLMPPLVTAEGEFIAGKESAVNGLTRKNIYSIQISATSKSFPAAKTSSSVTINSLVPRTVTVDPEATWLRTRGNATIVMDVDSNLTQVVRQGFITIRFATDPVFIQRISVKQNGLCVKPVVAFNLDPGGNTVCIGQSFSLNADVTNGLDEFFSFRWNTGDTSQMITKIGTASQTFTVTVTERSCNADTVMSITLPGMTVPVANAGVDVQTCPGIPVTLTGSPANGVTYSWSNGQSTKSIVVNPTVTTVYALTVSNGQCGDVDSIQVVVLPAPVANAGDDVQTCPGIPVTLTASPASGVTYLWNNGQTTKSIIVNPMVTTVYALTVSNGQCTDVDSIQVVVLPAPVANAGIDVRICPGETAILTAIEMPGNTYQWSTGQTTSSITVTPSGHAEYFLTVSSNGCLDIDTVTVDVFTPDVWTISIDDPIKCFGDQNGQLSLGSQSGQLPSSLVWSNGSMTVTIGSLGEGPYTVTVTDLNGCSEITTIELSQPDMVKVATQNIINPSGGNNGTIEISVSGGTLPYTYNWSLNGEPVVGEALLEQLGAGCYKIVVMDDNGCIDSIDCIEIIDTTVGIFVLGDLSIKIYPNPTDGSIYLETDNTFSTPVSVVVYQQLGNLILSDTNVRIEKNVPYLIDLSGEPPGVYYLHFKNGTHSGSQKLIIH